MNCCWIILLLLFCGQNGNGFFGGNGNNGCGRGGNDRCDDNDGRNGCGCDEPVRPCPRPEPPCARPEPAPCPCEDSRFEPRFEQRPFNGNGSTCGCEAEGN